MLGLRVVFRDRGGLRRLLLPRRLRRLRRRGGLILRRRGGLLRRRGNLILPRRGGLILRRLRGLRILRGLRRLGTRLCPLCLSRPPRRRAR